MSFRFVGGVSIVPARSSDAGLRKRSQKTSSGDAAIFRKVVLNNLQTIDDLLLDESWLRKKAISLLVPRCKCLREKQQHGVGWAVLVVCVAFVEGVFSVLRMPRALRNSLVNRGTEPV